jgi:pyruvate/2-oxoglutarate/acetoin dehydrogenase E1 component
MNVLEHLASVLAELVRADPRRVLLGEDVREGGMLGLSRVAAEDPALAKRLLALPLAPSTLPAHAAGLALAGLRPIVLLPSTGALVDGLSALREAALLPWRSGGERTVPLLFVAPSGPGFGLGGDAVEGPEAILCRVPGLRVVSIGSAREAGALLRAASEFWAGEEPTVLLLPRSIALQSIDEGEAALTRPFGSPHVVRDGSQATVFAWGECVELAAAAVERSGYDVGVVDVECLAPLQRTALIESAKVTGKIVIAHSGPRDHGVGAELAALFADAAILHLDAPVTRVSGLDAPLRRSDEARATPALEELTTAITHVATY